MRLRIRQGGQDACAAYGPVRALPRPARRKPRIRSLRKPEERNGVEFGLPEGMGVHGDKRRRLRHGPARRHRKRQSKEGVLRRLRTAYVPRLHHALQGHRLRRIAAQVSPREAEAQASTPCRPKGRIRRPTPRRWHSGRRRQARQG